MDEETQESREPLVRGVHREVGRRASEKRDAKRARATLEIDSDDDGSEDIRIPMTGEKCKVVDLAGSVKRRRKGVTSLDRLETAEKLLKTTVKKSEIKIYDSKIMHKKTKMEF